MVLNSLLYKKWGIVSDVLEKNYENLFDTLVQLEKLNVQKMIGEISY